MEEQKIYTLEGYSTKIAKNTFYSGLMRIWGILVSFFLTPYILHRLGVERFGIWAIVWVLTGYMSLMDMGLAASFIRHTSMYYVQNNMKSLKEMISSGLFFYMLLGILLLGCAILLAVPILYFFKISPALKPQVAFIIILSVINLVIANMSNVFNSIFYGLQRLDICFKITAAISLQIVLGTIFVLENGYGLEGLMYNYIFASLTLLIVGIIVSYKILGGLWTIKFSYIKIPMLKKLISFGFNLQFTQLAQIVSFHYDKILISYFLGISQVTYYELGSRFVQVLRAVSSFMIPAITPAASEIDIKEGKNMVWELYIRVSKYFILIGIPVFLFSVLEVNHIIFIWIGNYYYLTGNVVRILSIGFFLSLICTMVSSIVWGIGRVEMEFKRSIVTMVLNLSLSFILILKFGFLGAVFGTTISLVIGSIYFIKIFKDYFEKSSKEILSQFFKPGIAGLSATVSLFLIKKIFVETMFKNRIDAIISVGIKGLLFFLVYSGIILSIGYLNENDKALIKKMIPVFRNKR